MAVVDADYGTLIELCRTLLAHGQTMHGKDIKQVIAVLKDAISRMDVSTELNDVDATWTTQKAILAAFDDMDTAADIVAAIATAITAIDADVAALVAVDPGAAPDYASNAVADG